MRPGLALLVFADLTVVALMGGCGASLGDGNGTQSDASGDTGSTGRRDGGIDAPPDARPCMGGTMAMPAPDGSCFVFLQTVMTNVNAKAACAALTPGAHLAYLKTSALDTAGEAFIGTVDTWIGASDRVTEGTFVWDDNAALTFTNWHAGEPNSGGVGATYQEDCVIIAGARVGKQWDDRPCDASEVAASGMFAALCQY